VMAKGGRPPLAPHVRARRAQERERLGRKIEELISAEIKRVRQAGGSMSRTAALQRIVARTKSSKRTLLRALARTSLFPNL
jgi:hypothetical protein